MRLRCPQCARSYDDLVRASDLAVVARVRDDLASGRARGVRRAARLSMAEVASACGVSPQAVSYWERGEKVPSVRHALAYGRLLAAVGCQAA